MPAATDWSEARSLIRQWRADPEAFAEECEIDPPCREACLAALRWIHDMQQDGRHRHMQPTRVDHGPNGEIAIEGTDSRAGNKWTMHFWESD